MDIVQRAVSWILGKITKSCRCADDAPISFVDIGVGDQFSLHERCLQEGVCPRGCGPLEQVSYTVRKCALCGFTHFNATPGRSPHQTS